MLPTSAWAPLLILFEKASVGGTCATFRDIVRALRRAFPLWPERKPFPMSSTDSNSEAGFDAVIRELQSSGLIEIKEERVIPTLEGFLVADSIPLLFS